MNKKNFMICAAIMLLAVWSCEDKNNAEIQIPYFSVRPSAITPTSGAGTYELTIKGYLGWTATVDASWCTLSETTGTGEKVITVSVEANPIISMRSAFITVTAEDMVRKVKVLQDHITLGPGEVLIDGIIWSTRNVGNPGEFTAEPDVQGLLYQFNRKVGYPATGVVSPANWPASYVNDNTDWLPENDPCPEGWRVPTQDELVNVWTIGATWRSPAQTGFAIGGVVIGIIPEMAADATKTDMKGGIFLPQSGWRTETGALDRDWLCAVSCGTQDGTHNGRVMPHRDAGSYNCPTCGSDKAWAVAVRCVKDIN
ncbi:MAG: BACON domain-containing protein [Bacteroidales bacterium]|jgi:hypothetical protein|nr:BACON domain-containing protein [Bacteroidales bacterium]